MRTGAGRVAGTRLGSVLPAALGAGLLVILALALPVRAHGAIISETFDGFAAGTVLTGQVAGVTFLDSPVVFNPTVVPPASEPNAVRSAGSCLDSLSCPSGAWKQDIAFDRPARIVRVEVGKDEPACFEFDCTKARMLGFDAGGTLVADSRTGGPDVDADGDFGTTLRLQAATYAVKRVRIMFGLQDGAPGPLPTGAARAQFDSLQADVLDEGAPVPPPVLPAAPSVTITEPGPGFVTDQRALNIRARVAIAGAPTALCARVDAAPGLPSDCGTVALAADRTAAFLLPDLTVGPRTITVFARDGFGQVGTASVTVEIVRDLGVDIETDLLDISQAVQDLTLPRPGRDDRRGDAAVSYRHREYEYAGVPLVRTKQTFVRLHARLRSSGRVGGDTLPAPRALLHGLRGGRPLPGSPLSPRFSPERIGRVPLAQRRADAASAYEFLIPYEWLRGAPIQLVGEVNPPALPGVRGTYSECEGCIFDNAFRMDATFRDGRSVGVAALKLLYPGVRLPRTPYQAFARLDTISPVRLDVTPWLANIDVSDVATDDSSTITWRVQGVKDFMGIGQHTIGLHDGRFRGLAVTYGGFGGFLDLVPEDAASASVRRPLTSAAHELGHLFGYPHAGTRCPDDGTPGDWPPDQRGEIAGWALDPSSARRGAPARVFGKLEPGSFEPAEGPDRVTLYDLMSYCVTDTSTETDAWIGTRRWRQLANGGFEAAALRPAGVEHLGPDYVDGEQRARDWPRSAAARAGISRTVSGAGRDRSLAVTAIVEAGGAVKIVDARPSPSPVSRTREGAPFTLAALDAAGARLAAVSAAPVTIHDHGAPGTQRLLLRANLPLSAKVGGVRFSDAAGAVQATRRASASAPRVRLLAPRAGRVPGSLRVAWRASDADGDRLSASVELSVDGGARWRILAFGPRGSSVTIPAAQLPATRRGRVRVRVNDGLRTTTARSGRLTITGGAPQILPLVDAAARSPRADERVLLSALAWDAGGRPLRGAAIRWLSRGRTLGTGERLSVPATSIGGSVTIVARDGAGRAARRSVTMKVAAVAPSFLRLGTPAKVRPAAKTVRLSAAATIPAKLTARAPGARAVTVSVGRGARTVTVPIRPGSAATAIGLTLRAGGRTGTASVPVARG